MEQNHHLLEKFKQINMLQILVIVWWPGVKKYLLQERWTVVCPQVFSKSHLISLANTFLSIS